MEFGPVHGNAKFFPIFFVDALFQFVPCLWEERAMEEKMHVVRANKEATMVQQWSNHEATMKQP
jgi:hypothetical protein|tara:strand:- start:4 stop:195 length:192 start_codon:yes stop_codon:yes gene_type:complete